MKFCDPIIACIHSTREETKLEEKKTQDNTVHINEKVGKSIKIRNTLKNAIRKVVKSKKVTSMSTSELDGYNNDQEEETAKLLISEVSKPESGKMLASKKALVMYETQKAIPGGDVVQTKSSSMLSCAPSVSAIGTSIVAPISSSSSSSNSNNSSTEASMNMLISTFSPVFVHSSTSHKTEDPTGILASRILQSTEVS
jgi:hypothetical protein